jgi:hypothetical protein
MKVRKLIKDTVSTVLGLGLILGFIAILNFADAGLSWIMPDCVAHGIVWGPLPWIYWLLGYGC